MQTASGVARRSPKNSVALLTPCPLIISVWRFHPRVPGTSSICNLQFPEPGGGASFTFGLDLRGREFRTLLGVFHSHFIVLLQILQLALLVIELDFRRLIDFEIPVLAVLVGEDKFHLVGRDFLNLAFDFFGCLGRRHQAQKKSQSQSESETMWQSNHGWYLIMMK